VRHFFLRKKRSLPAAPATRSVNELLSLPNFSLWPRLCCFQRCYADPTAALTAEIAPSHSLCSGHM